MYKFINARKLKELKPIINEFITYNEKLANVWKWKDVPWWYTERAQTGILATAIHSAGGFPLEEYRIEKRRTRSAKAQYIGRNDLYFHFKSKEFYVEAKHIWCSLKLTSASEKRIARNLEKSRLAVGRISEKQMTRLGILFISPYVTKSTRRSLKNLVQDWDKLVRRLKCPASFYFFYPKMEKSKIKGMEKTYYPGLTVLVRRIKRHRLTSRSS